jgi:small subunit ribosomal protein S3
MGQKVHPYGFRLGVTKNWRSRWFAKQDYSKLLHEDIELKKSLVQRLKAAGISSIEVDRPGNKLRITIRTSRPGIIISRKGADSLKNAWRFAVPCAKRSTPRCGLAAKELRYAFPAV